MNCEEANKVDLVEYIAKIGFSPAKILGNNYWYLSPLRNERTPSFKIDRAINLWYDHGEGKGGDLVAFVCTYSRCDVSTALSIVSSVRNGIALPTFPTAIAGEIEASTLLIKDVRNPITDLSLIRYINSRNISLEITQNYCQEIDYEIRGSLYNAIGFKNNAGGYELRSWNFKGSSSPKYVTYLNNGTESIALFEGFFDFLSYCSMADSGPKNPHNFLVMNSLSFFNRSLLLLEKHSQVHLFLDNDKKGKDCAQEFLQRNPGKTVDQSILYKEHKDLNEWWEAQARQTKVIRPRRRL